MDFKIIFLSSILVVLSACTDGPSIKGEENLIGVPLEKISTLAKLDGTDSEQVAIFDETTRKIHQFQLEDMTYLKSFQAPNPGGKHSVLLHENGNYVIDFTEKHLTIFSKSGDIQSNPIKMMGQPLSAAFRSELNLLVVYDDLNSVGIVRMDSHGDVSQSWVGGPLINNQSNISAGDLLASGELVLALENGIITVADITQTLAQTPKPKWVVTATFNSGLADKISWVSPVTDNPNQIFVKAGNQLVLYDLATQTQLDSLTVSDARFEKLSKASDGHVITRNNDDSENITIYFVEDSKIQSRSLNKQGPALLTSYLNVLSDQWSFVETSQALEVFYWSNNIDSTKQGRILKMLRLSDMVALQKTTVADHAQALLSPSFVFALYPSELGYAVRFNILTGETKEAKFFNVGHIQE